jgi:hypothetical protein
MEVRAYAEHCLRESRLPRTTHYFGMMFSIRPAEDCKTKMKLPQPKKTGGKIAPTATDEESTERVPLVNEQALTDRLVAQQWEWFKLPLRNDFVGGIHGLTDLGF